MWWFLRSSRAFEARPKRLHSGKLTRGDVEHPDARHFLRGLRAGWRGEGQQHDEERQNGKWSHAIAVSSRSSPVDGHAISLKQPVAELKRSKNRHGVPIAIQVLSRFGKPGIDPPVRKLADVSFTHVTMSFSSVGGRSVAYDGDGCHSNFVSTEREVPRRRHRKIHLASSANTLDLLVDFGVDGIFITNSLVSWHRRSVGHGSVDPVAAAAHSGAVRLANRAMATIGDTSARSGSGRICRAGAIGTGRIGHLGRVAGTGRVVT